jgi:hypothetical protein
LKHYTGTVGVWLRGTIKNITTYSKNGTGKISELTLLTLS